MEDNKDDSYLIDKKKFDGLIKTEDEFTNMLNFCSNVISEKTLFSIKEEDSAFITLEYRNDRKFIILIKTIPFGKDKNYEFLCATILCDGLNNKYI